MKTAPERQKVLQTAFEKAVANCIEDINKNRAAWELTKKSDLLNELKIDANNYSRFRKSFIHIPIKNNSGIADKEALYKHIHAVLTNNYGINPDFLKTNKGAMYLKTTSTLSNLSDSGDYLEYETISKNKKRNASNNYENELMYLRQQVLGLQELVASQRLTIQLLQEKLQKS